MTELFPILFGYQAKEELRAGRSEGTSIVIIGIPWPLIAAHEKQCLRNHNQTAKRLAERGGLGADEAVAVLEDRPFRKMSFGAAHQRLFEIIETSRLLNLPGHWRCFHCDEVFTDPKSANDHFGDGGGCDPEPPACKLNAMEGGLLKLYREALQELHQWQVEDNASAREFYALGAEHAVKLRQEEEKGYARGLGDRLAVLDAIEGMIENCADGKRNPDSLPMMILAIVKEAKGQ